MHIFVLDASMTLAWCFEDEATEFTQSVLQQLQGGGEALSPSIWPYEVGNGVRMAERRGRIEVPVADRIFSFLGGLPVEIVELSAEEILGPVASLARSENLTIYDASYLRLAILNDLPLASGDGPLKKAALRRGVPVIGP